MERKRKQVLKCYHCGAQITFSAARRTKTGKWIPQDALTGGDHDCPESPYNQKKRWRRSKDWRESYV